MRVKFAEPINPLRRLRVDFDIRQYWVAHAQSLQHDDLLSQLPRLLPDLVQRLFGWSGRFRRFLSRRESRKPGEYNSCEKKEAAHGNSFARLAQSSVELTIRSPRSRASGMMHLVVGATLELPAASRSIRTLRRHER
jgi:hypothetical protein